MPWVSSYAGGARDAQSTLSTYAMASSSLCLSLIFFPFLETTCAARVLPLHGGSSSVRDGVVVSLSLSFFSSSFLRVKYGKYEPPPPDKLIRI